MKISVVIPNLNSPVIGRTIQALAAQFVGNEDCQAFVVGCDERRLVNESQLIRFIRTDVPISPAAARNIGIRQARGEIICFLDADCIPRPDWLKRIEQWFLNPTVSVLGGGVYTTQTGFWSLCDHISNFHDYLVTSTPGKREQLPSLNLMIRKEIILQAIAFDESRPIGEDSDLTTRLRLSGHVLHFDPQIAVTHLPDRKTFSAIIWQAWQHGYHSIKIDSRWQSRSKPPLVLRHRALLLIASPILALAVTARIFLQDRSLWHYWYAAPVICVLKIVWCLGAIAGMPKATMEKQRI